MLIYKMSVALMVLYIMLWALVMFFTAHKEVFDLTVRGATLCCACCGLTLFLGVIPAVQASTTAMNVIGGVCLVVASLVTRVLGKRVYYINNSFSARDAEALTRKTLSEKE